MTYYEKLYRVWGEYLNYPQCCVDDFIERVVHNGIGVPFYMRKSPFYLSDYHPCRCCHEKTKDMSEEEAFKWLGRNPFEDCTNAKEHYQSTLNKINTERFQNIACMYDFDVVDYRLWLDRLLEGL